MTPNIHPPSLWCLAAISLFLSAASDAQPVITPPPVDSDVDTSPFNMFQGSETPQPAPSTSRNSTSTPPRAASVLSKLQPRLLYRYLYADGIQSSPARPTATTIHELAAHFSLDVGSNWKLNYQPIWTFYSHEDFRDTVDHNIHLSGGTAFDDWRLHFSQDFQTSSAPLVATGGQTSEELCITTISSNLRLNDYLALELSINQGLRFVEQFPNSYEWSTLDWLHYRLSSRTITSLGFGAGYTDMSVGADASYRQLQGQIAWSPSDAITLQLHVGSHSHSLRTQGSSEFSSFIYGVTAAYTLFPRTLLTLGGTSTVAGSYFANQFTQTDEWHVQLQQRILGKVDLDLGFARHSNSYVSIDVAASPARKDDYNSFNVRVSLSFLRRGTLALSYQWSENSSDREEFGFASNQFGIEIGYGY